MTKKKNNKLIIAGSIVGAVLLILVISIVFATRSSTTPAYLNIEDGVVEVDIGKGWQGAVDGMPLKLNHKVRTHDGSAILVLYESIIVNLQQNTEIVIADLAKDNVKIQQNSGTTWNKFTRLAGVAAYHVETPNTVATVRGTDFEMTMDRIFVGSGEVDFKAGDRRFKLTAGMTAGPEGVGQITEEDRTRMLIYKKKMLNVLRDIRSREIAKNPTMYVTAKTLARLSEDEAQIRIQKMDWGMIREDTILEKSLVKVAPVEKFVGLTKEIKKEKQDLERLGYTEPKPNWMQPNNLIEKEEPAPQLEQRRVIENNDLSNDLR